MNWILTAWRTDNPQYGHALHLAIGWLVGLVFHALGLPWWVTAAAALVLAFHEVLDHDFTGGEPWNGACDALAFQPALLGWLDARLALAGLVGYAVALVMRGREITRRTA